MVIRMRHTRAHSKNRRSHHALKDPALSTCADCKSSHLRHRACENCGKYRGKQILNVEAKLEKKAKKAKEREKAQAGQK